MTRTAAPDRTLPAPGSRPRSDAPIEPVAITDWVLCLSSSEYARCLPPAGIAPMAVAARPVIAVYTAPSPLISTVVSASDVADRNAQAAPRESLKEHSTHDRP